MTDVEIESSKHAAEVMVEISACALEYNRNRCRPEEVVPAMEKACGVWETCMNRDPRKVARASVTAKTFAMIFNSFVEEFSYKSMVGSSMTSLDYILLITSTKRLSPHLSFLVASISQTGHLAFSAHNKNNKHQSPTTSSRKPPIVCQATATSNTASNLTSKIGSKIRHTKHLTAVGTLNHHH